MPTIALTKVPTLYANNYANNYADYCSDYCADAVPIDSYTLVTQLQIQFPNERAGMLSVHSILVVVISPLLLPWCFHPTYLFSALLRHCVDLSPVLLYVRGAVLVLRGYVLVRQ